MNITNRQKQLLKKIVEIYHQGCEQEFTFFITSAEGSQLIYSCPGVGSVSVQADESDFQQLEKLNFIAPLRRIGMGLLKSKPTPDGINAVIADFSLPKEIVRKTKDYGIDLEKVIELIQRQLDRAEEIERLQWDDPKIGSWENTTYEFLKKAFGNAENLACSNAEEFLYSHPEQYSYINPNVDSELQHNHVVRTRKRKELLVGFVEQLQAYRGFQPKSSETYFFHPEIEEVSGQLFRQKNFDGAVLKAYSRVIEQVKKLRRESQLRESKEPDGIKLMSEVFSFDVEKKRIPVVAVNGFNNELDQDEQRGYQHLFMGMTALRNLPAHASIIHYSEEEAYEYLVFAGLLMRKIDASLNPKLKIHQKAKSES